MNRDEARTILLLYRPGTADARDPDIAAALALARGDRELTGWLAAHGARQEQLRAGFRQIAAPAGLKEQIITEQAARGRPAFRRPVALLLAAAAAAVLFVLAPLWLQYQSREDVYPNYRNRMAGIALRVYKMDLETNDLKAVRAFLAQRQAPADYALPPALEKAAVAGCAVESWQGAKVSMICFRTGRPLRPGEESDLWLFVIDRSRVKRAPSADAREFAQISRLQTVSWTVGDKLYLLGTTGDEAALRQYL